MKKCPNCAAEIQDTDIKCSHCGEMIEEPQQALPPDLSAESIGKPSPTINMFLIPIIIVILLPLLTILVSYRGVSTKKPEEQKRPRTAPSKQQSSDNVFDKSKHESMLLRRQAEDLLRREDRPDYAKVLELFNKSIKMNPNDAFAYQLRGDAHVGLTDYNKALKDYNKAISMNMKNAQVYGKRGFTYGKIGQYQKAIEDFDQAISLDPNDAWTYNNRGFAYYNLVKPQKAIEDFNQAIHYNPIFTQAYFNRGVAYGHLQNYQQSIEDYSQVINLDPMVTDAYVNRGYNYYYTGKERLACDDWRMVCEQGNCNYLNWAKKERVCK
ncbi:MAG: tetratricopeptide repeat protein [Desulfobacterales bacterium]|nr:MAG: tetratricopeptide repeat protein [Desulfobacterales bacterium]